MNKSYDRHLNIFWSYNGNPHLEDNLTRAFIVTLSLLDTETQINIIEELLEEKLDLEGNIRISFDLQTPYIRDIRNLNCKKYLVGFNPSGKTWGSQFHKVLERFQDYNFNEELLRKDGYEKYLLNCFPDMKEDLEKEDENKIKNYEKLKDIILTRLDRGDSRIDGWLFIHKEDQLLAAIGIETKLWDLDPYQLSNHCEKSLGIPEADIKYKRFKSMFDYLKTIYQENKTLYIISHFLDYMEKLGYYINNEFFTEDDFFYAWKNNDYHVLNEKFDKYLKSYFNSSYFDELKEKYKLDPASTPRKFYLENIGKKGIGNIYFDSDFSQNKENEKSLAFFIGTEIGVASNWWNEKFTERLTDHNFTETLKHFYSSSQKYTTRFEVFSRINQASFSDYIFLEESDDMKNILKVKTKIPYSGQLRKDECIEKLKKLDISNNHIEYKIEKLKERGKNSNANNYNMLSYLRFIDYVENKHIYEISENKFNKMFHEILIRHLEGLSNIYKEL